MIHMRDFFIYAKQFIKININYLIYDKNHIYK